MKSHAVISLLALTWSSAIAEIRYSVTSGCEGEQLSLTQPTNGKVHVDGSNCNSLFLKNDWKTAPLVKFPKAKDGKKYMLLMLDPDAPNHSEGQYFFHWAVANIHGATLRSSGDLSKSTQLLDELLLALDSVESTFTPPANVPTDNQLWQLEEQARRAELRQIRKDGRGAIIHGEMCFLLTCAATSLERARADILAEYVGLGASFHSAGARCVWEKLTEEHAHAMSGGGNDTFLEWLSSEDGREIFIGTLREGNNVEEWRSFLLAFIKRAPLLRLWGVRCALHIV